MPKVTTIPATISANTRTPLNANRKRRVAAYARVSTEMEEQANSYEAQVDYYTNYIKSREDWVFAGIFTDEGISGTSTAHREGFRKMIETALAGGIDLIVTKSVSRFARNTVDSLVTIRKLKENGIEVFFEKEAIWTFDGKGELLITIMSSLAQEESRSISENVTWGKRKRFQDGKVEIPYGQFLGYVKGPDDLPAIDESQAAAVREIYNSYLLGNSPGAIARSLMAKGIPSPRGLAKWYPNTVLSILRNEKYTGNAILQKTFSPDFLTKKRKKNTGEVPKYYVEDSHPAIITKETFDLVQAEISHREENNIRCGELLFSGRIFCGECGSPFGPKVWHSNDKYRRVVWRCDSKYEKKTGCSTGHVTEDQLKEAFTKAVGILLSDRDKTVAGLKVILARVLDTGKIEKDIRKANGELDDVSRLLQALYSESVSTPVNSEREESLGGRYRLLDERVKELQSMLDERNRSAARIRSFLKTMETRNTVVDGFDADLWNTLGDRMIVEKDGCIKVVFKDGTELKIQP
jgi:DNA invertase Pin-like site-specific DNA recombinase